MISVKHPPGDALVPSGISSHNMNQLQPFSRHMLLCYNEVSRCDTFEGFFSLNIGNDLNALIVIITIHPICINVNSIQRRYYLVYDDKPIK